MRGAPRVGGRRPCGGFTGDSLSLRLRVRGGTGGLDHAPPPLPSPHSLRSFLPSFLEGEGRVV